MLLNVVSLECRFGDGPILFSGLSFRGDRGDIVALVGPSGSGKTTLLSAIAGNTVPTAGHIEFPEGSVELIWVLQNPIGVARRRADDHVALPLVAAGCSRRDARHAANTMLARFGLPAIGSRRFGDLSGGEAQRVLLARACCTSADLVLADEPSAQLDPAAADLVIASLRTLAEQGKLVVVASHDQRVQAICDTIVEIGR